MGSDKTIKMLDADIEKLGGEIVTADNELRKLRGHFHRLQAERAEEIRKIDPTLSSQSLDYADGVIGFGGHAYKRIEESDVPASTADTKPSLTYLPESSLTPEELRELRELLVERKQKMGLKRAIEDATLSHHGL